MKILITGANGQLGTELLRQLSAGKSALGPIPEALKGAQAVGVDMEDGDLAVQAEAFALVGRHAPDVVINCAAFTNVDGCETQQDAAFAANAVAARNLARACEARGAKIIHVSTDYVFAGNGERPYVETDLPAPRSVYGGTKLMGESYLREFCSRWFIVRTAWLYGKNGKNFVKTMQALARERGAVTVVSDQMGNPTNAEDLAHHLLKLAPTEEYGLYHCTGEGVCSWFDFADEIIRASGIKADVTPCTTEEFSKIAPQSAPRPAYSALDNAMLRLTVGNEMRPWKEALGDYIRSQGKE